MIKMVAKLRALTVVMVVTVVFMIAPVNRRHFLLMKMVHARRLTSCNFTTTGAIIAILEAKTMR